ncbi:MAG: hypothetical protein GC136_09215 [Alphaproteobacteria bacterium]|nr:hypothetical protein [Alphaproteobacteria bacterium]
MKINKIFVLTFLLTLSTSAFAIEPTKSPLISITIKEFLQLPENHQSIYVAGAIDGMTFVTYGYALGEHDQLVDCYRKQSLGELTKKVTDQAKKLQELDEGMAMVVAKTAGSLCREKQ